MALIVEDGSNVADSNTYVSEGDLNEYLQDRGLELPQGIQASALIIRAMDYVERYDFLGERSNDNQSLSFPRRGVFSDGIELSDKVIPSKIKKAVCQLAYEASSQDLLPSSDGKMVVRERVEGAVDVSYSPNQSSNVPSFPLVDSLLSEYISSGSFGRIRVRRE